VPGYPSVGLADVIACDSFGLLLPPSHARLQYVQLAGLRTCLCHSSRESRAERCV